MTRSFAGVLLFACTVALARGGDLQFEKHVIDDATDYSAAALIDVDGDGKLDVVCGGAWYHNPAWIERRAADVPRIGGRPDGFSHLEFDVNRDGFVDVITVNFRSRSIKWMENPGELNARWTTHLVAEPGPMETGRLVDIDGDGRLDLLPNGRNFAAWWELRWPARKTLESMPAWIRHDLPNFARGHGIGFGDIDGDGRGDIVGQNGWLRAPADARVGRWTWHPEFTIERGSIPMLVVDPDEDGDNDVVWCSAHGFGVYWLEQTRTREGERAWERHAIDASWSQGHAPLWADLDGDGRAELIAGKRYMAHGGSDPGAYDPLVIYRYQFHPTAKTWNRWTVSIGDHVGLGLDPKVADIDSDGDLDILACGRSGLYWLENQGPRTTRLKKEPPSHFPNATNDHVTSQEAWGAYRSHLASSLEEALGDLPGCIDRVPLNVVIHGDRSGDRYRTQQIEYSVRDGCRVPATLLTPHTAKRANTGGVVCFFGSASAETARQVAHRLASQGLVCIVPEFVVQEGTPSVASGVWQAMRAADVLQSSSAVHGERIAFMGGVQAGFVGLYLAALDQRFVATFADVGRSLHADTASRAEIENRAHLLATIAPRAIRVALPERLDDAKAWNAEAHDAAPFFALRRASNRLVLVPTSTQKDDYNQACDWIREHL